MKQTAVKPKSNIAAGGFSLIELLVVIAIIALLAAIIFPVFATVRENGRQKTSLSNLHDISTKLEQYRLDHKTYPHSLFGEALPDTYPTIGATYAAMDKAYDVAQAADAANVANPVPGYQSAVDQYFDGLYPEYIRDVNAFTDGNNPNNDYTKVHSSDTIFLNTDGSIQTKTVAFYTSDAYDSSPLILGTNKTDPNTYVTRYSSSWTGITSDGSPATGLTAKSPSEQPADVYKRQLRWQNPPSSTYVASTSYHVPYANKVLVLWESGSAKAVDASVFLNAAGGSDSVATPTGAVSAANFWQIKP
ncbi:hypothetical protein CCAX7_50220 [Capsulimonas corticalis]|uniref:Uncharacterized protein n=1 Tax=Capsulimonas corticalis TaxID=2219043 RepID=A0A402CPK6_9BACT|nr:prepilin-type N-terminal cleavage/methylation domain-containing protein [Capsulimonas corticalis]BDI32971.1 hypothetical protein CCAX7_50220 [Capsulimonas corticalis]